MHLSQINYWGLFLTTAVLQLYFLNTGGSHDQSLTWFLQHKATSSKAILYPKSLGSLPLAGCKEKLWGKGKNLNILIRCPATDVFFYFRNPARKKFQFLRNSPDNKPLAKQPKDSGSDTGSKLKRGNVEYISFTEKHSWMYVFWFTVTLTLLL